jgi:hypothetical protein
MAKVNGLHGPLSQCHCEGKTGKTHNLTTQFDSFPGFFLFPLLYLGFLLYSAFPKKAAQRRLELGSDRAQPPHVQVGRLRPESSKAPLLSEFWAEPKY